MPFTFMKPSAGLCSMPLTKKTVGKIVRVQDHGAYPILEVDAEGLEVLVPLPDHMLMKVDRERGVLEIELPEGLLDVYLNPSEEDVDGNTEEEDPDSFSY